MKSIITSIILLSFSVLSFAQKGEIHIEQDSKISDLMDLYTAVNSSTDTYRIQVYFGSLSRAESIKSLVDVDFPGWYSKIDFESPSYRVRVGRFKSKLEAERKLIEVRKKYPSAMLLQPEREN